MHRNLGGEVIEISAFCEIRQETLKGRYVPDTWSRISWGQNSWWQVGACPSIPITYAVTASFLFPVSPPFPLWAIEIPSINETED